LTGEAFALTLKRAEFHERLASQSNYLIIRSCQDAGLKIALEIVMPNVRLGLFGEIVPSIALEAVASNAANHKRPHSKVDEEGQAACKHAERGRPT
jgi:hypothetical protein